MTGFVFFESFYEMLKELEVDMRMRFYAYICEYGLYGTEPELSGVEKALWIPIKLSIDSMQSKQQSGKRGRPRKDCIKAEIDDSEQIAESVVSENCNDENMAEQSEAEADLQVQKQELKKNVFKKPSLEEVKTFVRDKGYQVNPEQWYAYYEANGWRTGKNSMKNWQAAIRYWESNSYGKKEPQMATDDITQYLGVL